MSTSQRNQFFMVLAVEETARLVNELVVRLEEGQYLPAIGTLQALVARASDLSDLCSAELAEMVSGVESSEPPVPAAGYL